MVLSPGSSNSTEPVPYQHDHPSSDSRLEIIGGIEPTSVDVDANTPHGNFANASIWIAKYCTLRFNDSTLGRTAAKAFGLLANNS